MSIKDMRSGRIVIASHCLLNIHSIEDDLALYPGLEEKLVSMLKGRKDG